MVPETVPALSALLQLGRRVRAAENAAALGFVVVNESRAVLDYRQSAVGLPNGQVTAISGLPEVDRDAPFIQWLSRLFRCLDQDSAVLRLDAANLPAAFRDAVGADWDDWMPRHVLLHALCDGAGRPVAYWLLARDEDWLDEELAVVGEMAGLFGHAMRQFAPRPRLRDRWRSWLGGRRRRLMLLGIVGGMLLLPVRLTVLAPAEVTPKDAFPVRAPLDGAVDVLHVRPNQAIAVGQPLLDLDTSGLHARLSVARQAYETAAEEYRLAAQLAVADDEKGRLDLNQRRGRMEEKAAELAYSEQLLDRVQVKSPRDGVAVFSDAADWVGKAVVIGERIMLIADPERVEMTIRLPVSDAIDLEPDAEIRLYLTNAPQFSYAGRLTYAAYKAEARAEGVAAYTVKADFVAEKAIPRLGLTGTAKIYGGRVPFIYYVFRRPLSAVRQWLGW